MTVEERERFEKRTEILVEGLNTMAAEAPICWGVRYEKWIKEPWRERLVRPRTTPEK